MYNSNSNFRNYIPHKRPRYSNYNIWKQCYYEHLLQLYNIFISSVNSRYDNDVKWNDENNFEEFCKFIYKCSSKYITPCLKDDLYQLYDNSDNSDN
jgi:hypothetical protein